MHIIWNTVQHKQFPCQFEKKILFYGWREFLTWNMLFVLVLILQWIISQHNLGTYYSDTVVVFWEFQMAVHFNHQTKPGNLVKWHCACLFWEFQKTGHHHHPTNLGTWCSDTVIVLWGFQTTGNCHQQKYLKLTCVFCMGRIQVKFE